jgi:murein L,D-transpeptidase YafK
VNARRRPGRTRLAFALRFAAAALLFPAVANRPAQGMDYQDIDYAPDQYGPEEPLGDIAVRAGLALDEGQFVPAARLEILKSAYKLRLYSGDQLLKTYRIQLGGKHPTGDKRRRGDGRTPEGTYRVCRHNHASRYHRSLILDYPNRDDVDEAVASRRITEEKVAGLRAAHAAGKCPPSNTVLGGDILIHGQDPKVTARVRREHRHPRAGLQPGDLDPATLKQLYNWTLGCVGMTNPDIRELYQYIPDGTLVQITP